MFRFQVTVLIISHLGVGGFLCALQFFLEHAGRVFVYIINLQHMIIVSSSSSSSNSNSNSLIIIIIIRRALYVGCIVLLYAPIVNIDAEY